MAGIYYNSSHASWAIHLPPALLKGATGITLWLGATGTTVLCCVCTVVSLSAGTTVQFAVYCFDARLMHNFLAPALLKGATGITLWLSVSQDLFVYCISVMSDPLTIPFDANTVCLFMTWFHPMHGNFVRNVLRRCHACVLPRVHSYIKWSM